MSWHAVATSDGLTWQAGAEALGADGAWSVCGRLRLVQGERVIPAAQQLATVLRALEQHGADAAQHLEGAFAFIARNQATGETLLMRDRFGIQPLWYSRRADGALVAASSAAGVFAQLPQRPPVDERMIGMLLVHSIPDAWHTPWRGVYRLPPAHVARDAGEGVRLTRYWSVGTAEPVRGQSARDLCAGIRERFITATRRCVDDWDSSAAFLSGGIDSSAVVSTLATLGPAGASMPTFSMTYGDDPEANEDFFREAVTAQVGWPSTTMNVADADPLALDAEVRRRIGSAVWGPVTYQRMCLLPKLAERGVRSVFDGYEGDVVASYGIARMNEFVRSGQVVRALMECHRASGRLDYRRTVQLIRNWMLRPFAPSWLHGLWDRWRGNKRGLFAYTVISEAAEQRLGIRDWLHDIYSAELPRWESRRDHWLGITSPGLVYTLETWQALNHSFGIDGRFPFFDRELVEYCFALPAALKFNHGWTRIGFRQAMRGILPDAVRARGGKASLVDPYETVMGRVGPPALRRFLADPGPLAEYVDLAAVQRVHDLLVQGKADFMDANNAWVVVHLDGFLRGEGLAPERSLLHD